MENTFIYGLYDPRDLQLRYIGKADNPNNRLSGHIKEAKRQRRNSHLYNWMRVLLGQGLKPILVILEQCDQWDWQNAERFWIALAKRIGTKLTNWTEGGDGVSSFTNKGRVLSQEHKENLRRANTGKRKTDEHRMKLSIAFKGKNLGNQHALGYRHTDETKERISNTLRNGSHISYWQGKKFTDEHKRKVSEAGRGRIVSIETREKLRNLHLGRKVSPESRQRMSDAAKLRQAKIRQEKLNE